LMVDGSAAASAQACLIGVAVYGFTRIVSQVSKELQIPLFAPVGQVSKYHSFAHLSLLLHHLCQLVAC
jgi:hypothetical protein